MVGANQFKQMPNHFLTPQKRTISVLEEVEGTFTYTQSLRMRSEQEPQSKRVAGSAQMAAVVVLSSLTDLLTLRAGKFQQLAGHRQTALSMRMAVEMVLRVPFFTGNRTDLSSTTKVSSLSERLSYTCHIHPLLLQIHLLRTC
jgi:hypothetical protein